MKQVRRKPMAKRTEKSKIAKEAKTTDAVGRSEAWNNLSPQEQLKVLDSRLGKGVGAKKQRVRLASRLG
jgi:hypothetical protein